MRSIEGTDNSYITHSTVADLVFILIRIFNRENYYLNIYEDEYLKEIKEGHRFLREIMTSLPVKGAEILEFLLESKEFNNLEKFKEFIIKQEDDKFFYRFYGKEIELEIIRLALDSDKELNELYKKYEYISTSYLALKGLFTNKDLFLKELFDCLDLLNTDNFKIEYEEKYLDVYNEEERITKLISEENPLEASQKIMGKTFRNRGPYKNFVFVPTKLLPSKAIRYYDEDQILFYLLGEKELNKSEITKILKIISDDTRFEILEILGKSDPMMGKELAAKLKLSTPTISHHIDQLKEAGFINEERVKNSKYYSLNKMKFNKFIEGISLRFK